MDARQVLSDRALAYRHVFAGYAYDPQTNLCVADLRAFCRAERVTYYTDPMEQAREEGRREVWLVAQFFGGLAVSAERAEFLRSFCFMDVTCFSVNSIIHARNNGRREVGLRIHNFTTLTVDQLVDIYCTVRKGETDADE